MQEVQTRRFTHLNQEPFAACPSSRAGTSRIDAGKVTSGAELIEFASESQVPGQIVQPTDQLPV